PTDLHTLSLHDALPILAATECNGAMSGTIVGGIVVNAGAPCALGGANVSGGVQVTSGGILIVCASVINGNIVANGAAGILLGPEDRKSTRLNSSHVSIS